MNLIEDFNNKIKFNRSIKHITIRVLSIYFVK